MIRNVCFSVLLPLFLLVSTTLFFSCRSCRDATKRISCQDLPIDSVISTLLGDTVCSVLYAPSTVHAYKMRPQQADSDMLIAEYAIDFPIGELDASCYSILQFFLKDSANYVWTDEMVKTLFSPNICFKFTGKNENTVYLLLAFNGNQLKIVTKEKTILYRQFRNEHTLLRLTWALLPENKYIKSLLNTYK